MHTLPPCSRKPRRSAQAGAFGFAELGLEEFDFSLQKDIVVKEPLRVEFRAEAYNALNHPNFNIPNRTAFTPNFGSISSAQDSRQLQFALKLLF